MSIFLYKPLIIDHVWQAIFSDSPRPIERFSIVIGETGERRAKFSSKSRLSCGVGRLGRTAQY